MYFVPSRTHTPPGPLSQTCRKAPWVVLAAQPCTVGAAEGDRVGARLGAVDGASVWPKPLGMATSRVPLRSVTFGRAMCSQCLGC